MNRNADTALSVGAQMLIYDIANGCTVYPGKNGVPAIVMPLPGNPFPITRGQVANSVIEELRNRRLIPQNCTLTDKGREYYRRHLQEPNWPKDQLHA
jgi:hypothetical protein